MSSVNVSYEITEITQQGALDLISPEVCVAEGDYRPLGLFWARGEDWHTAIDNSTGCCWAEDFNTEAKAINYLKESGRSNERNN